MVKALFTIPAEEWTKWQAGPQSYTTRNGHATVRVFVRSPWQDTSRGESRSWREPAFHITQALVDGAQVGLREIELELVGRPL